MINKAIAYREMQNKAFKHYENGKFGLLKKYGVTEMDGPLTALTKINKVARQEALTEINKYANYHQSRLVNGEALDIKVKRNKKWADETQGTLQIVPHPDYCEVCAPFVFQSYPNEIGELPPYHPNCRCRAVRQ